MKKSLRALCMGMVFAVVLSTFAGCGAKDTSSESSAAGSTIAATSSVAADTKPDTSEAVTLKGYLLGAAPEGLPDVLTELNKRLKNDINATVEVNYLGWGDWQAKYPLVLASGEDVDWMFTADWAFYFQESAKGAFKEVSEDMIKKNMPNYYNSIDKQAFSDVQVGGKMYMIPTIQLDPNVWMAAIRGDLRKKYNVPEIKKFSELDPYLEAIKKNEPSIIPMNISTMDSQHVFLPLAWGEGDIIWDVSAASTSFGTGVFMQTFDPEKKILNLTDEPVITNFKFAANKVKSWYDKGYINKNVYANKTSSEDFFMQGKSGVALSNNVSAQKLLGAEKQNGWEFEYIPLVPKNGKVSKGLFSTNGVGIPKNAKNPERTMMFLDLITANKDYNMLVYYGIEGKNYAMKGDKIGLPEGLAPDKNTYAPDAAGFWFTDKRQFPVNENWPESFIALQKTAAEAATNAPYPGFTFNTEKVKSEVANCLNVSIQYGYPIMYGLVKGSVDDAFKTLDAKYKAAGVDKIKAEAETQMKAFVESKKK